jgi:hypothetical protein
MCQFVAYADDVNILGENMYTNKKALSLLEASMEAGLGVDKKTKYMLMSHHQNGGQNHNLLIANKSLKMWQSLNMWEQ